MAHKSCETLYLIEFMVQSIRFFDATMNSMFQCMGPTCVRIKFKTYPVLEILEEPDDQESCRPDEVLFKSGKSCLFSLPKDTGNPSVTCFIVYVAIGRKTIGQKSACEDDFFKLGDAQVDLTPTFIDLLKSKRQKISSKCVKDTYLIRDQNLKCIALLSLFTRVSSYGKLIMTDIQLGGQNEDQSFLFKAASDMGAGETGFSDQSITSYGAMMPPPQAPSRPCQMASAGQQPCSSQPCSCSAKPCSSKQKDVCGPCPPLYPYQGVATPCPAAPMRDPDYKYLYAQINGYAVNIKIKRRPRKTDRPELQSNALPVRNCFYEDLERKGSADSRRVKFTGKQK